MNDTASKPRATLRTIDIKPRSNSREAIKPAELIQINGHHALTLNARRAITLLWHNAHFQGVEEGKDYDIAIDELKPAGHKGYEMVEEAVEALMQTIITLRLPGGQTRRVQFLGGNDLDAPDRPAGILTYSFDKRLIEVLRDSTIWGKIQIPVVMSFSTKYAISLYENVAQFINLDKTTATYTLEGFREILGVQPGRYKTFGELNKHVIKPAVAEVNALASFSLSILPVKTRGKMVGEIMIHWWTKDTPEQDAAWQELQRTRLGRRARIAGTVEHVSPATPSIGRMMRSDRAAVIRASRKASPKTS